MADIRAVTLENMAAYLSETAPFTAGDLDRLELKGGDFRAGTEPGVIDALNGIVYTQGLLLGFEYTPDLVVFILGVKDLSGQRCITPVGFPAETLNEASEPGLPVNELSSKRVDWAGSRDQPPLQDTFGFLTFMVNQHRQAIGLQINVKPLELIDPLRQILQDQNISEEQYLTLIERFNLHNEVNLDFVLNLWRPQNHQTGNSGIWELSRQQASRPLICLQTAADLEALAVRTAEMPIVASLLTVRNDPYRLDPVIP